MRISNKYIESVEQSALALGLCGLWVVQRKLPRKPCFPEHFERITLFITIIPHKKMTFICTTVKTSIKFFFVVLIEMTAKGPQNAAKKNFHSSKEKLVEFGETPRGPRHAADFQHKQGRYNFFKNMAEFANSSHMFTKTIYFNI